jgi:GNAT superfamily N-acetyltransferase
MTTDLTPPGLTAPVTRVTSVDDLRGAEVADLSEFFNPFLERFVVATFGSGGEVTVSREGSTVDGLSLFQPSERIVSLFTRSPTVAHALLDGRTGVDVFSELSLAPEGEVYHVYAATLPAEMVPHRFAHPIREARPGDRGSLLGLLQEVYGQVDEGWFRPIPEPPEKGFVAEVDGRIVGAAWVQVVGRYARLHTLTVRAPYRHLGIGTDLWYARMLWAHAQEAREVIAEISEHRTASQAIAAAGGMRRVGRMYRFTRP